MTLGFPKRDIIDHNLTQAARHMALAVAELREAGDLEYAAVIQTHLHGLERPHWLEPSPAEPVLPALTSRVRR